MYVNYYKRLADIFFAVFFLITLSPVMLLVIVLIFLEGQGPIFFYQMRPGFNSALFKLVKFRTMRLHSGAGEANRDDSHRLTRLGRILRLTSIDELPELWNILRGEMSFIGPRPLLAEYLPLYSKDQSRRHCVRPGLTGLAQVKGRNLLSWNEKFIYDVYYVDNLSLLLDIKIFALTCLRLFNFNQVNSSENITMQKFTGTKNE